MTDAAWVFLVVAAVFAVGDWVAVSRDQARLEYVCKPGTTAALVAVAATLDPAHADQRPRGSWQPSCSASPATCS